MRQSIEIAGFTFGKIQIFARTLLSGGDGGGGRQGCDVARNPLLLPHASVQEELARTISQLIHVVNTPEARKSCDCCDPLSSGSVTCPGEPVSPCSFSLPQGSTSQWASLTGT